MMDISPRDVALDDDDWIPPLPDTDGSVDGWDWSLGSTEPSEGPTPIVAQDGRDGNLRAEAAAKAEGDCPHAGKHVPESRTPLRNVG